MRVHTHWAQVLDPIISRSLIKRGGVLQIKIGDKEVEYDINFRLYMQTKLSNPHYKPEVTAQTTVVNFQVAKKINLGQCFQS